MCPQLICIIGFGRLEARHLNQEGDRFPLFSTKSRTTAESTCIYLSLVHPPAVFCFLLIIHLLNRNEKNFMRTRDCGGGLLPLVHFPRGHFWVDPVIKVRHPEKAGT